MAKYKKKKFAPKSDENQDSTLNNTSDTPDIAKPDIGKPNTVDPKSVEPNVDSTEYKKKLDVLFWLRIGLAAIAGAIATFAFEPYEGEERRWISIIFMIIVFVATVIFAKSMRMQLPSSDRKKIITQGLGSYVFIYLFVWIVTYTLVNTESGSIIPLIS